MERIVLICVHHELPPKGGSFSRAAFNLTFGLLLGLQAFSLYVMTVIVPETQDRVNAQQKQIESMRTELQEATRASTHAMATTIEMCRARGHENCSVRF